MESRGVRIAKENSYFRAVASQIEISVVHRCSENFGGGLPIQIFCQQKRYDGSLEQLLRLR